VLDEGRCCWSTEGTRGRGLYDTIDMNECGGGVPSRSGKVAYPGWYGTNGSKQQFEFRRRGEVFLII